MQYEGNRRGGSGGDHCTLQPSRERPRHVWTIVPPMDATQTINHYEHSDVRYTIPADRREEDTAHLGEEQVDLLPARGVLLSVVIGAALWAVILAAGWLIFR
jgi:hypothetical protein